jgi:uncharacterized membrane protein
MKVAQTNLMSKPFSWYRWLLFKTTANEMDRMLTLSMVFSITLVMARVTYTGEHTYLSLIWNLFLAWLPYMISTWLQKRNLVYTNPLKFVVVAFVWLLFIPNSFYIMTDLFHLGEHNNVPNWFDLALIISFAWDGLLLGILSVRQMEKMMERFLPGIRELFIIYPIMWLNALGIYIGRYPRFNSWDTVTNPIGLTGYILRMLWHPIQFKYAWGMVACFSIFMTLVYLTIKRISKSIH